MVQLCHYQEYLDTFHIYDVVCHTLMPSLPEGNIEHKALTLTSCCYHEEKNLHQIAADTAFMLVAVTLQIAHWRTFTALQ